MHLKRQLCTQKDQIPLIFFVFDSSYECYSFEIERVAGREMLGNQPLLGALMRVFQPYSATVTVAVRYNTPWYRIKHRPTWQRFEHDRALKIDGIQRLVRFSIE